MASYFIRWGRNYRGEMLADALKLFSDSINPLNGFPSMSPNLSVGRVDAPLGEGRLQLVENCLPERFEGFLYASTWMRSLSSNGDVALVCRSSVHVYA